MYKVVLVDDEPIITEGLRRVVDWAAHNCRVAALAQDAAANGVPLTLVCVTGEQKGALQDACPGRFAFEEDRDGFDYLYDVGRLADLPGKKLHAKRNHIRRFDDQFPDWLLEDITPANVPECVELERQWAANGGKAD